MTTHTCHAIGCKVLVPPAMFMCKPHWYSLPLITRNAVWKYYREGQEIDKDPSPEYLLVTDFAEVLCAVRKRTWTNAKARRRILLAIQSALSWLEPHEILKLLRLSGVQELWTLADIERVLVCLHGPWNGCTVVDAEGSLMPGWDFQ